MERQLSPFERALWAVDQIGCCNVAVTARVEGPLADAALRRALRRVQHSQPLLGTMVDVDPSGAPRFAAGSGRVPLRTVDLERRMQAEAGWQHQTEYEINTRFAPGSRRCGWSRSVRPRSAPVNRAVPVI